MSKSTHTPPAFSSSHTSNLPLLFKQLGISLVVNTYQANKTILVRAQEDSDILNTHFVEHNRPMGLCVQENKLAVGTKNEIIEYTNVPDIPSTHEHVKKHDACFVLQSRHITGDIDIHEMEYDHRGELWFVNTRFSCLCTRGPGVSFIPQWKPNFISGYSPQDRCHLNGLALKDGAPRFVTALGKTDGDQQWRDNKKDGGILIDIARNEIVRDGLSMPHSPRWHKGALWALESGRGQFIKISLESGERECIAQLPGFTRGISFIENYAFIGVSQVRDTALFSDIPLVEKTARRQCGVWIVNITNGNVVGFIEFNNPVQEIFSVLALRGTTFPRMLSVDDSLIDSTYILPSEALALVKMQPER